MTARAQSDERTIEAIFAELLELVAGIAELLPAYLEEQKAKVKP
jgi:hypothetical protein